MPIKPWSFTSPFIAYTPILAEEMNHNLNGISASFNFIASDLNNYRPKLPKAFSGKVEIPDINTKNTLLGIDENGDMTLVDQSSFKNGETYKAKFKSKGQMLGYTYHKKGNVYKTFGYHKNNDGGGAYYSVVEEQDIPAGTLIDGYGNHDLGNGLFIIIHHKKLGEICAHQYGAKGDVKAAQGTNDLYSLRAALAQCKAYYNALDTAWAGHTTVGWVVRLANRSYGLLLTQEDVDNGADCALPVSFACGIKGGGRHLSNLVCLNGFVNKHVVANERWATKGPDGFLTLKDFSIWGRRWDGASPKDGVHINVAMGGYTNTDNFLRLSGITVRFCLGNGFYLSGRGEGMINDCQANNNQVGWQVDGYVDSMFQQCNAGGNRETGFKIYKAASCKFTTCKSYYNGVDGGSDKIKCANWAITADAWISGNITFTACESQESRGSGWYIATGNGIYVGCLAQDPKRAPIGSAEDRPEVCAGFHLDRGGSGWSEEVAKSNHFANCTVIPGLTLNYSDRKGKSFNGDYAIYIHPEAVGNTGDISTYPQSRYDKFAIGGGGAGGEGNPLLSVDGEYLIDGTPPSAATVFIKSAVNGALKVYATQEKERNHKITDYLVEYLDDDGNDKSEFLDVNQPKLIKDLTIGSSYDIQVTPISRIGKGNSSLIQNVLLSDTRKVYVKDSDNLGSDYFISNKKLIDLDAPNIKFSFTVSDRTDLSSSPQSIIRQGTADDSEFEFLLINEFNYRIKVGGNTYNGGVGKPLTSGTFDVVVQPNGVYIYKNNVLESAKEDFIRGSKRIPNALTYLMKGESDIDTFNPFKGALRTFKTNNAYFEIDNTSGVQPSLEGDLTANFTLVDNGGGGAWVDKAI